MTFIFGIIIRLLFITFGFSIVALFVVPCIVANLLDIAQERLLVQKISFIENIALFLALVFKTGVAIFFEGWQHPPIL